MLNKLLRIVPFSRREDHPKPPTLAAPDEPQDDDASLALKIVHPGGSVECYYMAIPASHILDKHPSFVLAKPEVFRRPWDSVVRPEKILRPGQKFLLVPLHTVRKLRRRIRKPKKDQLSENGSTEENSSFSSGFKRKTGIKKHVRFAVPSSSNSKAEQTSQRRATAIAWQPSLTSVSEIQGD